MRLSLGIDLGTTNSVVATNAQVLSLLEGDIRAPLLPSAVAFLPDGGAVVGAAARERKPIDPKNTVYASKRLMGENITSYPARQFQLQYPHDIEECPTGGVQFITRAGPVRPAEIAALIASHLCMRAMFHPAKVATVVTVPSGFREAARLATVSSIRQAGFTDLRLLDEPVATAVAYLHRANLRYAAVYDLGGGTFDFALIDCSKFPFRIIGHSGDPYLGGDDIDSALADIVALEILKSSGWDLKSDPITYARLMLVCEQAKCALALDETTQIDIAQIDPAAPSTVATFLITRDMLTAASYPLIQRTFGICDEVLAQTQLKARDVQAVFMAGGSTRLFMLHSMVNQYFGRRLRVDLNPEHVVALGASMVAARPELWPLLDPA
ncbi:MAG: Chaperone protein DnaK [Myxococcaceae bacterium]|nr:Chaperone protein DnaK [Myxococcaceae bacterium]